LLASELLAVEPGAQLPTVRQLAARHRASLGATQDALAELEADGAFEGERRGRLGTILRSRSVGILWNAAEGGPLIASLPLPTTPQIEGLATAIKALFADAGVEAYLSFSRGSRPRLVELWQGRCQLVVMSALAANELCGRREVTELELPAPSFVREHRVYYTGDSARDQTRGLRVVIDRDSVDFQRLTELEFDGTGATFIPASYMEFPRLLKEGAADAVIWDVEEAQARTPLGVRDRPLSPHVLQAIGDSDRRAAFVCLAENGSVRRVVKACLNTRALQRIEGQVLDGTRVPSY
jgi:hypothetical protein